MLRLSLGIDPRPNSAMKHQGPQPPTSTTTPISELEVSTVKMRQCRATWELLRRDTMIRSLRLLLNYVFRHGVYTEISGCHPPNARDWRS